MANSEVNNGTGGSLETLKNFQLDNLTIKEKSDWQYGKNLAQAIEATINGGSSSYFWLRNQRWRTNRNYANGRVPMQKFMDLLEFNGKTNYLNLNWQSINIVNRIVSGLVGRWMNKNEKIQVTATDSLSVKDKEEQYSQLEFIIDYRRQLEELETQSGVEMIPKGSQLPSDKEELFLWKNQFQKLPEEIGYEMGCNDVLASVGWFDVLKEKMLHDLSETGFMGASVEMDEEGVIHPSWEKPENCFYSYSDYPDFRDTTWRGVMKTRKISYLRKKYSKEFHPDNPHALTEQQLFDIAATSKSYQLYDNITWQNNWNITFIRPYDEWNVTVIEFEIKTVDSEPYTVTKTKTNNSTIIRKGRGKVDENSKIIEDTKVNIYRGCYERATQTMLEWGLKKNMIRPQDPKESGNAEFSYSFYMVQNYDMTCLAIPEKIQEPVDQMIIARLKMQQLVSKMRPTGSAINWDAVQNIDYGLGDQNKAIDVKKLYDQTGDIYYRGKDAEGNPIPVPIVELQNSGFLPQLQGLILLYDKHYQIVKDELGEDPNLIQAATQPRVTTGNVDVAQQQAAFSTDYFYSGYALCTADIAKKISCLLKTSVVYGSKAYRKIVSADDIQDRIFSARIQMLPDEMEIARFEAIMNNATNAHPELLQFLDPFQLMRVAKEDVKLAESLFRQAQKKLIIWQQQTAAQNQKATIEGQIASAQEAEKSKQETERVKGEVDIAKVKIQEESSSKTAVLTLATSLLSKGEQIPAYLMPLINATVENIMIPMVAQNEEQKAEMIQQMKAAQEQPEQQEEEVMEQPQIQQPQQDMAA